MPKYNPAGDALVVAYSRYKSGDLKGALVVMSSAFSLEGMDKLTESIDEINAMTDTVTAKNEYGDEKEEESREDELSEQDEDDPEDMDDSDDDDEDEEFADDEDPDEDENDEDNQDEIISAVLAELDDEPEEAEMPEDNSNDQSDLEDQGPEDEINQNFEMPEEDEDETEEVESPIEGNMKKCTSSYMDHIAVANRASLSGDRGSRELGKKLLKSVA